MKEKNKNPTKWLKIENKQKPKDLQLTEKLEMLRILILKQTYCNNSWQKFLKNINH